MTLFSQRHAARELALKMLFQVDIGRVPVSEVLAHFEPDEEIGEVSAEAIVYAHALVRGTAEHFKEIDNVLASLAEEWTYDRLANVDRNVLRLAVYELFYEEGVPEEVAINEAVELAKEYSTEESGKFVNGILGNVSRQRAAGTLTLETPEELTVPIEPMEPPLLSETPEDATAKKPRRKRQALKMGSSD